MSVYMQILLGLIPAMLVFASIAIFKKPLRLMGGICGGVLAAVMVAMAICNFTVRPAKVVKYKALKSDLSLTAAMAIQENGADYAAGLMREIRKSGVDDPKASLCDAYLHALNGDATAAKVLCLQAQNAGAKDEKLLSNCDAVLSGTAEKSAKAMAELKKYAKDKLNDSISGSDYIEAAQILLQAEQLFDNYISEGNFDSENAQKYEEDLKDILESDKLATASAARRCYMRLLVLNGKYDTAAEMIDGDSGFDELAIASELYVSKAIEEDSFSKNYGADFGQKAKSVQKQLKSLSKKLDFPTDKERREMSALIERIDIYDDTPAISRVKDGLAGMAADINYKDRSKAYWQLAKLAFEEKNKTLAEQYIVNSLETGALCDDNNYSVPLNELTGVLADKENTEKLKDITDMVESVSDYSGDVLVSTAIKNTDLQNNDSSVNEEVEEDEKDKKPLFGFDTDDFEENQDNASNGADEKPLYNEDEQEEVSDFNGYATDTINQVRIALSINRIDASGFPTVKATVAVDREVATSAEEFKHAISVMDCQIPVDYTVEKMNFKGSNVLLCCDISGSMSGTPINDLKDAVKQFIETSPDTENVALLTFNDGIVSVYKFSTEKDVLIQAAEQIYSGGGTNMYGAVFESLSHFNVSVDELNYILLLSDGQDGNRQDIATMSKQIGEPARYAGVTLYSLGVGSGVDSEYMKQIASVTGGEYVAVADTSTLNSFYTRLRNQATNRYVITYNAVDTLRETRTLHVSNNDNPTVEFAEETYYKPGFEEVQDGEEESFVTSKNISVSALNPRQISTVPYSQTIQVIGEGFVDGATYGVKLVGPTGELKGVSCTYVDTNRLDVTIPGGIACGSYDVYIYINKDTAFLKNGLKVFAQDSEKTTAFGPYVFTSYTKIEDGNTITLSDNVVLNGWLGFNDTITLNGDIHSNEITLEDLCGSYLKYNVNSAEGYAKTLAQRGEVVEMGAFGRVVLKNVPFEDPSYEEYPAERFTTPTLLLPNLIFTEKSPSLQLYPNRLVLDVTGFSTDLPLQDQLMMSDDKKFFEFDASLQLQASNTAIDVISEVSAKLNKDEQMIGFGNQALKFGGELEVKIDTASDKYSFELDVEIPGFFKGKVDSIGMFVEWQGREGDNTTLKKLWPYEVRLKADAPFKGHIGPVPVTLDDFQVGLKEMDLNKSILEWKLVGMFDFGVSKIGDYLKGLDKKVGEVSLLKFDDTTVSIRLKNFYIGVETKLSFLDNDKTDTGITLGEYSIELGYVPFTVELLDMRDVENYGMRASSKEGIIWDTDNCDVDISGQGVLSVNPTLFAMEYTGNAEIDIKWWIFNKHFKEKGIAMVGFYRDSDENFNFTVRAVHTDKNKTKGYFLNWNSETGSDCGTLKR